MSVFITILKGSLHGQRAAKLSLCPKPSGQARAGNVPKPIQNPSKISRFSYRPTPVY